MLLSFLLHESKFPPQLGLVILYILHLSSELSLLLADKVFSVCLVVHFDILHLLAVLLLDRLPEFGLQFGQDLSQGIEGLFLVHAGNSN